MVVFFLRGGQVSKISVLKFLLFFVVASAGAGEATFSQRFKNYTEVHDQLSRQTSVVNDMRKSVRQTDSDLYNLIGGTLIGIELSSREYVDLYFIESKMQNKIDRELVRKFINLNKKNVEAACSSGISSMNGILPLIQNQIFMRELEKTRNFFQQKCDLLIAWD